MSMELVENQLPDNSQESKEIEEIEKLSELWPAIKDNKVLQAVKRSATLSSMKHGLAAGIPIICRGNKCPYVTTCFLAEDERPVGERCPIEMGAIISRFEQYCRALDIGEDDVVDMALVRQLVDIEIQMLRADNKMAIDGDFIEQVVAAVTEDGRAFYKPELHKAVDLKDKLRKDHHRILQLLNSTRKDRERLRREASDPSILAATLMAKVRDLEKQGKIKTIIDISEDEYSVTEETGVDG